MEAIKYRWSGDHKTVLDLGCNDTLLSQALSIAIDTKKDYFKELVNRVYKKHELDTMGKYFIADAKRDIRKLYEMKEILDNPAETTDRDDAKARLSKLL